MRIKLSLAAMLLFLLAVPALSEESEPTGNLEKTREAIDKGWDRTKEYWSDASITNRLITRFLQDEEISGFKVRVSTDNRVITLTGNLKSERLAQRAMDIAGATEGVTDVINNMFIVTRKKSSAR